MSTASVRIVSLAEINDPRDNESRPARVELEDSLRETGVVLFKDHGIDPDLLNGVYDSGQRYFDLPEDVKQTYEDPANGRQRGHASFGVEHAKDTPELPDLKQFWHHGRILPPTHPYVKAYGVNRFVKEVPGFTRALDALYECLDAVAMEVLKGYSRLLKEYHLWLPTQALAGDSILRLIDYPAIAGLDYPEGCIGAGKHEDIDLCTLIPPSCTIPKSSEARLVIMLPDGNELIVPGGAGLMVCQTGDMTQLLSGGLYPSTTHLVKNSADPQSRRFSAPFFVHPPREMNVATLQRFTKDPKTPRGVFTAGRFLFQRLIEIGIFNGENPYPI